MASTSFMFMLVCVPEPVCQTDERELAVVLAGEHLVGGGDDRVGLLRDRARRASRLTTAALRLTSASARISSRGMRSVEMSKWCSERCVCAPHSRSAGTSMSPKVSFSMRWLGHGFQDPAA